MRFFYAKHNLTCKHCGTEIQRGNFCVMTSFCNKETGDHYRFCYHQDCYLEDYKQRFIKSYLYWKAQQNPPKKMGRPMKSSNPMEYNRLKALQNYHRNLGHTAKVEELQKELDNLALVVYN